MIVKFIILHYFLKRINGIISLYKFLGQFEIVDIKKRWRNLRDSYTKARKKATAYIPSGSGTSVAEKQKHGFRFYHQMEFLDDILKAVRKNFHYII